MMLTQKKLILWTGKKHSGKTTGAAKLVRIAHNEGFDVAGLLAEALYLNGRLIGFDAIDLRNETRAPLARLKKNGGKTGRFDFVTEGVKLGSAALSPASTEFTDLIVVDEFGPLEMNFQGWRKNVDLLVRSSKAVILLVVRQELVRQVRRLYANIPSLQLSAAESKSINKVISILKNRRQMS